jgi:hypothetical protein
MDFNSYIFLGVGVAISVLGFFLKKEARKTEDLNCRVQVLEIKLATNSARDDERWHHTEKLLEDRRADVRKLYDIMKK